MFPEEGVLPGFYGVFRKPLVLLSIIIWSPIVSSIALSQLGLRIVGARAQRTVAGIVSTLVAMIGILEGNMVLELWRLVRIRHLGLRVKFLGTIKRVAFQEGVV
jgi:hypothetical protein